MADTLGPSRWQTAPSRLLARLGSATVWRAVAAFACALVASAACAGGLMSVAIAFQAALVGGIAAGLVGSGVVDSAIAAGAGAGLALLVGPPSAWSATHSFGATALGALIALATAAAVAAGTCFLRRRGMLGKLLLWAAIALIVGNLWYTTLSSNSASLVDPVTGTALPSFNQQLRGQIVGPIAQSDDAWYLHIYQQMRGGTDFYDAFHTALKTNPNWRSTSVADYRTPTIFWFWALLPDPGMIVIAFLVLASVAIALVPVFVQGGVRAPFAIVGAAVLAGYLLDFAVQLIVFGPEIWAALVGVLALVALAISYRSARWRWWVVTGVVLASLTPLIRETMIFLPVAGAFAAAIEPSEQRRFRVIAWAGGIGSAVALYVAHAARVAPLVTRAAQGNRFFLGSAAKVAAAVTYGTDMFGFGTAWPWVFAALGLIGVLLMPRRAQLVTFVLITFFPLISFFWVGNIGWTETSKVVTNYWGSSVMPFVYLGIPFVFALLPGVYVARGDGTSGPPTAVAGTSTRGSKKRR